jgi:hypothetical protein
MTRNDHTGTGPDGHCEAFQHPDGWYEIREADNVDGWLRTDGPVPLEP